MGLAEACGYQIAKVIAAGNIDLNSDSIPKNRFIMGKDGFSVQRSIYGLAIYARWLGDESWTKCNALNPESAQLVCENMFIVNSSHSEALDGVGPDVSDPTYSYILLTSLANGMGSRADLEYAAMTSCGLTTDREIIKGSDPGMGIHAGRKFPVKYSWEARYKIAEGGKLFELRYMYEGYSSWVQERAVF